jgi:hypothetical protein
MFKTEKEKRPTADKICIEFVNQSTYFDDCRSSKCSSNDCEISPNETGILYISDNRRSTLQIEVL